MFISQKIWLKIISIFLQTGVPSFVLEEGSNQDLKVIGEILTFLKDTKNKG